MTLETFGYAFEAAVGVFLMYAAYRTFKDFRNGE